MTVAVKEGVFAGLDSDNNLYFYLPTSRIFRVYNFDEPTVKLRELTGIKDLENVHIMSRDPCNKELVSLVASEFCLCNKFDALNSSNNLARNSNFLL